MGKEQMASVSKTLAQKMLEFALGQKSVSFGELSTEEGDKLLRSTLEEVNLRELRGFKPLKDLLIIHPGSFMYGGAPVHTLEVEFLDLDPNVSLHTESDEEKPQVNLDTYVLPLSRVRRAAIFKRHESDEETRDYQTAVSWGRSAYHHRGNGKILALRRPNNHTRADENLVIVEFKYEKIPLEARYVIKEITTHSLPLEKFREHFGSSYERMAVELISELQTAYERTSNELKSQLDRISGKALKLGRLSNALEYIRG
ncbi:MAG: hypothetical protein NTU85_01830 [Candidatus Kaiserbacteria bacterium]|nr:hypothetical protein [Candidatus Kaiserbacteria bacterium]